MFNSRDRERTKKKIRRKERRAGRLVKGAGGYDLNITSLSVPAPFPAQDRPQGKAKMGKSLRETLRDVRATVIDEMDRAEAGLGQLR